MAIRHGSAVSILVQSTTCRRCSDFLTLARFAIRCDAIGAPAVSRDDVLRTLDDNSGAKNRSEEVELQSRHRGVRAVSAPPGRKRDFEYYAAKYRKMTEEGSIGLMLWDAKRRQAEQAIAYFKQVQPPDAPTSMNLLAAELMAGHTKDAATLAAQISEQNENNVRVHFSLGVLLAELKLYPSAVHELEIADAMQPGTFEILYNLGQAYFRSDNNIEAQRAFQRALTINPESPTLLCSLGRLYYTEGRDLQALQVLTGAHKLAPQNTDVIFLMARVSMVEKYFEDAIPLLQEGIKIDPKRPDLHAALGDCYFTRGKTDEAIREFQNLIDLAPTAGSYAFMGLCYRHLGRYDEARKYLMKGLKLELPPASLLAPLV